MVTFASDGVGRDKDVDFLPFYRLPRRTYAVYWDVLTPESFQQRHTAELAAQHERKRKLDAATVSFFTAKPGEMQPERDFNFQGEPNPILFGKRAAHGRVGRDWFSFELPVDAAKPMVLVVTYYSGGRPSDPNFEILVEGERIAEQALEKINYRLRASMTFNTRFQKRSSRAKRRPRFDSKPVKENKSVRCSESA